MKRSRVILSLTATSLLLILAFQNCNPAGFADVPPAPSSNPDGTNNPTSTDTDGDPDTSIPVVTPNPSPAPIPEDPVIVETPLPKIYFDYNPCSAHSECSKTMTLSRADNRRIRFQWKTNEVAANAKPEIYCVPTSGYTPTQGLIEYAPGVTEAVAKVMSKSCAADKQIPLTIFNCTADGDPFNCALLIP